MTTFSIILPILNNNNNINECLEHIQNQTFKDFEVICIVNSEADNTLEAVNNLANSDNRFKIININESNNFSKAMNLGLDNTIGEYILFINNNDLMHKDALESINQEFKLSDDIIAFGYNIYYNSDYIEKHCYKEDQIIKISQDNILDITNCIYNKVFRASKIKEFNIKFTETITNDDIEFIFKLLILIKKIHIIPQCLYNHNNIASIQNIDENVQCIENIYTFLNEQKEFKNYKRAIINWICQILESINSVNLPNRLKILEKFDSILERINFPKDFNDINIKTIFFK